MKFTLHKIQHEVACVRRGRPGYRWAPRYLLAYDGKVEYPPQGRKEARERVFELAKQFGAVNFCITYKDGEP